MIQMTNIKFIYMLPEIWNKKCIRLKSYRYCTVMQIEKPLINDRLYVSKVSWKFRIPFLTVSIDFSVSEQNFTAQQLKN